MNLRDAVIEAVDNSYRWGGAAIVVTDDGEDGIYNAIPAAYLSDASYNGSKDVVITIAQGEFDEVLHDVEQYADSVIEDIEESSKYIYWSDEDHYL